MAARCAEVVLDDGPVAVRLLRRAVDRLAAREDEPLEAMAGGRVEHVRHPEHVDPRSERWIGLDLGAHQVGELDAVRHVGLRREHRLDRLPIAHVEVDELRAVEPLRDVRVHRDVADGDRNPAAAQVPDDARADEPRAAGDEELHASRPRSSSVRRSTTAASSRSPFSAVPSWASP